MKIQKLNLGTLLNEIPSSVYWKDLAGVYLGCNEHMAKMAGVASPQDIIGKTDYDLCWHESADAIRATDQEVIHSGVEKTCEEFGKLANGSVETYLSTKSPLRDEHGKIIGVVGVSMNIENLKKREKEEIQQKIDAENKYQMTSVYLENILANLPEPIYWMDVNSVVQGCNDAEVKFFGFKSADDLIGKSIYDFAKEMGWNKSIAEKIRRNDKEIISTKKTKVAEENTIGPNGEIRTHLSYKAPLYGKDKKVIGIIGTSVDITHIKKLEDDLRIAKDQAQLMNKTKTEFLANMSHDLKTPLAGIMSNAEILIESTSDSKSITFLDNIRECGRNLMLFFDNCLELSKLENADVTILMEPFSLKETVDQVVSLFRPAMTSKNLDIKAHYDKNIPPYLIGSKPAVYRILQNLMGNAIKFTSKGFVGISVSLDKKISAQEEVVIKMEVSDSGMGIPADKQKIIFDRLTRLTLSHQGVYEGSGIGLYLVEKFVTAMHGQIHLDSEIDKGSIFTVTLPLKVASADAAKKMPDPVPAAFPELSKNTIKTTKKNAAIKVAEEKKWNGVFAGKKFRVLLVEDNKAAQDTGVAILELLGCEADIADTGAQANALFEPGKYAIVYMDIGLADMPGYEAAKLLREQEAGTNFSVPILALSAHVNISEKIVCFEAGMNGLLDKPLLIKKAAQSIEKFVLHKDVVVEGLTDETGATEEKTYVESQKIIDIDAGTKIAAGNRKSAIEGITTVIQSIPKIRDQIKTLFEMGDNEKLNGVVHKFYGGLCSTGLPRLRDAAKRLLGALNDNETEKVYGFYQNLLHQMDAAEKEYAELKEKGELV